MANTTQTWNFYNSFKERMADGTIDMDDASAGYFSVLLTTSAYTPSAAHTVIGDITNELAGNGYARQSLTSTSWSESGGTVTFDAADVVFTASGGDLTARYYVIFADGSSNDSLVGYGLLDNTPADVTTSDGNTLTLAWNASGIFTLA